MYISPCKIHVGIFQPRGKIFRETESESLPQDKESTGMNIFRQNIFFQRLRKLSLIMIKVNQNYKIFALAYQIKGGGNLVNIGMPIEFINPHRPSARTSDKQKYIEIGDSAR